MLALEAMAERDAKIAEDQPLQKAIDRMALLDRAKPHEIAAASRVAAKPGATASDVDAAWDRLRKTVKERAA